MAGYCEHDDETSGVIKDRVFSFVAQQLSASQEDCFTVLVWLVGNSFGSHNKSWGTVTRRFKTHVNVVTNNR